MILNKGAFAISSTKVVVIAATFALLIYETLVISSIYLTPNALNTMGGDSVFFTLEAANHLQGNFFKAGGIETQGFYDTETMNTWGWIFADHMALFHPLIVVPLFALVGSFVFMPAIWVLIAVVTGAIALVYAVRSLALGTAAAASLSVLYFATVHVVTSSESSLFINKGYPDILSAPLIICCVTATLCRSTRGLLISVVLLALTKELYIVPAVMFAIAYLNMDRRNGIFLLLALAFYGFVAFVLVPAVTGVSSHSAAIALRELEKGVVIGTPSKETAILISGLVVPLALFLYTSLSIERRNSTVILILVGAMAYLLIGVLLTNFSGHSSVGLVGVLLGLAIAVLHHSRGKRRPLFISGVVYSAIFGTVAFALMGYRVVTTLDMESYSEIRELQQIQASLPPSASISVNVERRKEAVLSARRGYYRYPHGIESVRYVVFPNGNAAEHIQLIREYSDEQNNLNDPKLEDDINNLKNLGFISYFATENYEIWVHPNR